MKAGKIAIVAIGAVLCLIPHGKALPYQTAGNTVVQNQNIKETTTVAKTEVTTTMEKPETETTVDVFAEERERFYQCVRGFWKGYDNLHYTFTKVGDAYLFFSSKSRGCEMTNKNFYIADYRVSAYESTDEEIICTLVDTEGKTYEVIVTLGEGADKTMSLTDGDEEIFLICDNCYSYEELMEKDSYDAYYYEEAYGSIYVQHMPYEKDGASYGYVEMCEEFEGRELLLRSPICYIWGMEDGIVVPLRICDGSSKYAKYDAESNTLWAAADGAGYNGTFASQYRRYIYDAKTRSWEVVGKKGSEEFAKMSGLYFCDIGEDYDALYVVYQEEVAEEEAERNFTVDESMAVVAPLEDYAGIYYKEYGNIYLNSVADDMIVVTHTDESNFTITGILARTTEGFPEGTAVYEGTVKASGRFGHTGSFSGQIRVVLKPDGDIYVKRLSGDTIYQDGTHSKKKY